MKKSIQILRKLLQILVLIPLILLLGSCGASKTHPDIKKSKMFYHNTTAKYNGYFNAQLIYDQQLAQIDLQHQDNYNQVLPLHKYTDVSDPKAYYNQLDEAIKKVSIVVALHRISQWTDDCYLLLGKSQFVKQDYEGAEETFAYMVSSFDPLNKVKPKKKSTVKKKAPTKKKKKKKKKKRKKKKKKKKPSASSKSKSSSSSKSNSSKASTKKEIEEASMLEEEKYGVKHRPVFYDGLVWLIKTKIERGLYDDAEIYIDRLENDPAFPTLLKGDLSAAKATLLINQRRYSEAVAPIETAISLSKKKKERTRFTYVLAQVLERTGSLDKAMAYYGEVLKANPPYEMAFNANLNQVRNEFASGSTSIKEVRKTFDKMLKDDKNVDYLDQIYYALSDVSLKEGNNEKAIEELTESIALNTRNKVQRGESYLKLAELYFNASDYVNAKSNYDMALKEMNPNDERFSKTKRYADNLAEVARNILIITQQDSLLAIKDMTDEQKMELAKAMKSDRENAREKGPGEERAIESGAGIASGRSSFWAYNTVSLERGMMDFKRKWGTRQLADNWRVSSKLESNIVDIETPDNEVKDKEISKEELDRLFADVPKDAAGIAAANKTIEKAMLDLGVAFREKLDLNDRSIETLEGLLKKFPKTEFKPEAYYYLYAAYSDSGNSKMAKVYKDKLLKEFSESSFAKALKNPNAPKETSPVDNYYNNTYASFESGDYKKALNMASQADNLFGTKNNIKPKFALLSAMCLGSVEGKESYVEALKALIAQYPKTAEEEKAREILVMLGESGGKATSAVIKDNNSPGNGDASLFKPEREGMHYVIVVLEDDAYKLNEAKTMISDYNKEYYSSSSLKVASLLLDVNTPIIVVRRFSSFDKSEKYHTECLDAGTDFLGAAKFTPYIISQENYKTLLRKKDLAGYIMFYGDNY